MTNSQVVTIESVTIKCYLLIFKANIHIQHVTLA